MQQCLWCGRRRANELRTLENSDSKSFVGRDRPRKRICHIPVEPASISVTNCCTDFLFRSIKSIKTIHYGQCKQSITDLSISPSLLAHRDLAGNSFCVNLAQQERDGELEKMNGLNWQRATKSGLSMHCLSYARFRELHHNRKPNRNEKHWYWKKHPINHFSLQKAIKQWKKEQKWFISLKKKKKYI